MISIRNISIRNKLVLMQVFTSILVLGIFSAAFIITDIRDYKQRKVNSMLSLAQVIGTNSASAIEFQDADAAKAMLQELRNVAPDIIHAGILDKTGDIFASYVKPGSGEFSVRAILENKKIEFTDKTLFVSNDIINNHENIGKVFLEAELSELAVIKATKYGIATISLAMAFIFSVLIAAIVQTYISRRLLFLVNTMNDASRTGDYNKPIADDGKDEIGTLVKVYNNLMDQVKQSQQRKDEFIGIASHELKTPLTSIKGYLELLSAVEDRQPNKQFVQKASENVIKLEKLIRDLLDVSKIQSGQLELNIHEFNIGTLVNETIEAIQMGTVSHQITMEGGLDGLTILADRQRIEQVMLNLLSNAVKYSPDEKKVIVYGKKIAEEIVIRIRDFGKGIPEEEQSKIFGRFYRSKEVSINISGFGLGLYICNDIIRRHNGRIWIESEVKGSSFYFSLPIKG